MKCQMASKHPRGALRTFLHGDVGAVRLLFDAGALALYLTEHLRMTKEEASDLYGSYMFFVYLTRFSGESLQRTAFGVPSTHLDGRSAAQGELPLVFRSRTRLHFTRRCFLMVISNGLFKVTSPPWSEICIRRAILAETPRFSIFYMGINLGALFAGPVGEFMRTKFGWPLAFATAGIGMVFSF